MRGMTAVESETAVPNGSADVADEHAKAQGSRRGRAGATRAREAMLAMWARIAQWWAARSAPTDEEKAAPDIRRSSVFSQPLPTITDLVAATRAGLMVPGDWPKPIELAGKAYGWCVAVPVSLALYGVAWTVQKPTHLLGVAGFLLLLAVSL